SAATGTGRSASTIAPSARLKRPRSVPLCGSEMILFRAPVPLGEMFLDRAERNRRRQHDPPLSRAAGDFGHSQEWLTRQRRCLLDGGAAAVPQQETSVTTVFRDPIRIRETED